MHEPPKKNFSAELWIEKFIFRSRWLLAPFYVGLVLGLLALLIRFCLELSHLLSATLQPENGGIIPGAVAVSYDAAL